MRDTEYLKEQIADAIDSGKRAIKALDRGLWKLQLEDDCYEASDMEDALKFAVRMLLSLKETLAETYDTPPIPAEEYDPEHALCVDADYESPHILRCDLPPLPVTKHSASARGYTALCSEELRQKICENRPQLFRSFRQAYVIYAHFDQPERGRKTPYYDNDNLAIKALLDEVVPLICVDDAACICDNLYVFVPSDRQETSLWIVEKGHLSDWAQRHPEMPILQELQEYFDQKTR